MDTSCISIHTEGSTMKTDEGEIRRKWRIFDHAVESGNVAKTCRYYGIPRSLFYVWRNAYQEHSEEVLRRKTADL